VFVCVCVYVCVVPGGLFFLPPPPHGFYLRENSVDGLVTLPPDLCFTLRHLSITPLPVADAHRVILASVTLMDRAVTSSHDGALLSRSGPSASWEIEGLHVEVKAGRRISCQLFRWLAQVL